MLIGLRDEDDILFADVRRLNADGTPDPTFNTNSGNTIGSLSSQSTCRRKNFEPAVLLPRSMMNCVCVCVKLNTDGSLDTAFNPAVSVAGIVFAIKRQADGKILIGGNFRYVNGVNRRNIARLNADGLRSIIHSLSAIILEVTYMPSKFSPTVKSFSSGFL